MHRQFFSAPITRACSGREGLRFTLEAPLAWRRINCDAFVSQRKNNCDAREVQLRNRLRGLIGELTHKLGDMDPIWLNFGLTRSSVPTQKIGNPQSRMGNEQGFRLDDSPHGSVKILQGLTVSVQAAVKMRAVKETGPGVFGGSIMKKMRRLLSERSQVE